MKIELEIENIDYGKLVEHFLPLIGEKIASRSDSTAASILGKLAGMSPEIAGKMVDFMPQDAKDEIAVMLVNKNKEKLIDAVMEYAEKNGISFTINNLSVQ